MKSRICLLLFFPVVWMWANNTTVNFEKEVFPLFEERCIECHQAPQEKKWSINQTEGRFANGWGGPLDVRFR